MKHVYKFYYVDILSMIIFYSTRQLAYVNCKVTVSLTLSMEEPDSGLLITHDDYIKRITKVFCRL